MISTKQRMWDLIRRKKIFPVSDILTLQGFSYQTARNFLIPLEVSGAIMAQKKCKFRERVYVLNSDRNEYKVPLVNSLRVYFHKSKTSCDVGARVLLKKALKSKSQQTVADELCISKTVVNLVLHNKYKNPVYVYDKIREVLG